MMAVSSACGDMGHLRQPGAGAPEAPGLVCFTTSHTRLSVCHMKGTEMLAAPSATNSTPSVRRYSIEDEAEGFQLLLFVDGDQIGAAFFLDADGTGAVFHIAYSLGESFVRSA